MTTTDKNPPEDALPFLGLDAILDNLADSRETRVVQVPEWGTSLRLRELSSRDRDRYELTLAQGKKTDADRNFRASLVAAAMVDEDGKPMVGGAAIVQRLGNDAGGDVMDRLFDVVAEMSGMGPGQRKKVAEDFG